MATKTTRTRKAPTVKKTVAKKPLTTHRKKVVRSSAQKKVNYYPNRMTVAISAFAGVSLMALCVMAAYSLSY